MGIVKTYNRAQEEWWRGNVKDKVPSPEDEVNGFRRAKS